MRTTKENLKEFQVVSSVNFSLSKVEDMKFLPKLMLCELNL